MKRTVSKLSQLRLWKTQKQMVFSLKLHIIRDSELAFFNLWDIRDFQGKLSLSKPLVYWSRFFLPNKTNIKKQRKIRNLIIKHPLFHLCISQYIRTHRNHYYQNLKKIKRFFVLFAPFKNYSTQIKTNQSPFQTYFIFSSYF